MTSDTQDGSWGSLQTWVDSVAKQHASRQAVSSSESSLTYACLRCSAIHLARRLCILSAMTEKLVGLYAERSTEMIIGVIGILYARAAYLPLDPQLKENEVIELITLAHPVAAVGTPGLLEALHRIASVVPVPVEEALCLGEGGADEVTGLPFPMPGTPTDVVYALFTSGSTGVPKCVVQQHSTVLHLFRVDRLFYGYSSQDAWMLVNPLTFDVSVSDIFNALTCGGELLVPSSAELQDARPVKERAVTKWLQDGACSVTSMTPSAFRRTILPAVLEGLQQAPPRLRLVVFSGEPVDVGALTPFFQLCPAVSIVNKYGLTEVQDVTYLKIEPLQEGNSEIGEARHPSSMRGSVGMALPGCPIYILKSDVRVPTLENGGEIGEIAVGGPQVAREYLGRPELTAERFLADPFLKPGRLFRTGDAGRWADDGKTLILLGRLVDQVRIDGHIVDLHHAETTLRALRIVKDVVLTARTQQDGRKVLLGFYVPHRREEAPAEGTALQAWCVKELPSHSQPDAFYPVDMFPVTSSGKVHRGALQPPEAPWQARTVQESIDLALRKEVGSVISRGLPKEKKQISARCNAVRREVLDMVRAGSCSSCAEALAEFHRRCV